MKHSKKEKGRAKEQQTTKEIKLRELYRFIQQSIEHGIQERLRNANSISIADFEVTSTTASLKSVEQTINRLINRHQSFAEMRKKKVTFERQGFF